MKTILDKLEIITLKKQGLPTREVSRITGAARNTISKIWKEYCDELDKLTSEDGDVDVHQLTERIVNGSRASISEGRRSVTE